MDRAYCKKLHGLAFEAFAFEVKVISATATFCNGLWL
jgi:hypothetical protein